jgi:hypothetical protein
VENADRLEELLGPDVDYVKNVSLRYLCVWVPLQGALLPPCEICPGDVAAHRQGAGEGKGREGLGRTRKKLVLTPRAPRLRSTHDLFA